MAPSCFIISTHINAYRFRSCNLENIKNKKVGLIYSQEHQASSEFGLVCWVYFINRNIYYKYIFTVNISKRQYFLKFPLKDSS